MKKGDLVMIMSGSAASDQAWPEPAVVIRNIYEGQSHIFRPETGKNVGTDIAPVVDVIMAGRIIKGVPVRLLERVT